MTLCLWLICMYEAPLGVKRVLKFLVRVLSYYPSEYSNIFCALYTSHFESNLSLRCRCLFFSVHDIFTVSRTALELVSD